MRLRGRKGIREELERQSDLVILDPKQYKGRWSEFFGNDHPIHVELGMGKGKFISELSFRNPEVNYIGVDMYDELIRRGAEKARKFRVENGQPEEPENLALALLNIEHISEVFAEGEVERIYLNFSDPWPKKKHARRRLTHRGFLLKYKGFLNEWGQIHLKTDSRSLFEFSLNSFADMGLWMRNISLDLHGEGLREDLVLTEYESKFVEQGINIHRCEVLIGDRALEEHRRSLQEQSV
ncbi:tRNA (guanosine(46)-N7)-methyltransferase TrmB [Paenibacillus aurantius]|uniref:tRNA (guanine-N(7)-)-methyltransferase n=1 Tax=Paenibacillus aurantius TaxID=2918900 RepID=A0AA96LDZ7_9BACL|nr:tRNA (guanosine(46)-N7)-methyltransferase TrmB [Paenibacillus aurantius]WJH35092.1 tRNA (guanosine(46)-N7)-methyltransferase TrmB [Paenibacillus sp. CC-CFT747]WNQ10351.1 tRNA (guanosine(46)-N7)-methyltransferase TrmB [Paenibacillus aurantius]